MFWYSLFLLSRQWLPEKDLKWLSYLTFTIKYNSTKSIVAWFEGRGMLAKIKVKHSLKFSLSGASKESFLNDNFDILTPKLVSF